MGCSSSKKSPLDPSDVQLSGGEPLSQLSGVSRSEQRQSSAANLELIFAASTWREGGT